MFCLSLATKSYIKLSFISFENIYLRTLIPIGFFGSGVFLISQDSFLSFSNYYLMLIIIFNSAISDSSAYLVGSFFGKNSLLKEISPNKTLEGFLGGICGSAIFGFLLVYFFESNPLLILILVIGSIFAFTGDYFFSFLKRTKRNKGHWFHAAWSWRYIRQNGFALFCNTGNHATNNYSSVNEKYTFAWGYWKYW